MLSIALNVLTGWEILVGKNISNNYKKDLTMKTQEELKQIKEEVEVLNEKLAELTDEEMEQVAGGKRRYERTHTEIEISCSQCGYLLD